jgi:hypothetical protein
VIHSLDNYIDRVAVQCVNRLTPNWSTKLAAFAVFVWDQCYAMEQSLRIDQEELWRRQDSQRPNRLT